MAKIVVKTDKSANDIALGVNNVLGGAGAPITERASGEYIVKLDKGQKVRYDKMSAADREKAFGGQTSEMLEG